MEKTISIIVPIYNTGKYLFNCINSLCEQSYRNIDIILVNDGSTDDSLEICKLFKEKDYRIQLINSDNKGVSSARNLGLRAAIGEYVCFVDSDDTIQQDYIKNAAQIINEVEPDLVIGQIEDIYRTGSIKRSLDEKKLSGDFFYDFYILKPLIRVMAAKFFNINIIKNNNIIFCENMCYGEDQNFNFQYYHHVRTYKYVSCSIYNYWHRDRERLTRKRNRDIYEGMLFQLKYERLFYENHNVKHFQRLFNQYVFVLFDLGMYVFEEEESYYKFCNIRDDVSTLLYYAEPPLKLKRRVLFYLAKYKIDFFIYMWFKVKWMLKTK